MVNGAGNTGTTDISQSSGSGAAAILSVGIGAISLSALAISTDDLPAFKRLMIFYVPTGPLSGVTTTAIGVWLVCWICLGFAWRRRNIGDWSITLGLVLLVVSFVVMIPPVGDLF